MKRSKILRCCKSRLRKQGLKRHLPPSLPIFYLSLQKSSTKTRIETWTSIWQPHPKTAPVAKVVYENKDWNTPYLIAVCNGFPVAKAVYKNKDWNGFIAPVASFLACMLQKRSTKTRIETVKTAYRCITKDDIVAKAVYKNKDWNIIRIMPANKCFGCCKSGLQKQGLKPFLPLQWRAVL